MANMSAFECSLTGKNDTKVEIPEGKQLNITSVALTLKRSGKGESKVIAKHNNGSDVIAAIPNTDKNVQMDVKVSFPASYGTVELSLSGAGTAAVTGTYETQAGKQTGKKRKVTEAAITDVAKGSDEPAAKEVKHGVPRILDIKRAWNAKPIDNEGVLLAKPKVTYKEKDLKCIDYVIGNGDYPKPGAPVKINYAGLLQDGTVFDSRMKRKEPLVFRKGVNQVVKGLDLGMEGMKVGGSREITVPPELGYGAEGFGVIPGNQTLVFRVTLLG